MIILSVDYGDARTGIAVCDKSQILASPVKVINEKNRDKLIEEICLVIKERSAEKIVLGLPKNMDGSEGFRCEACREFGSLLAQKSGLPVDYQDERLTTVSAHSILNATDTRGSKRKSVVDAVSAVLILEDYLSKIKLSN